MIPVLVHPDVRAAVAWLGDGAVIIADVRGEQQPPQSGVTTHLVKVRVPDVDAQLERARGHGARVLQEAADHEYGERECTVEDLAGHRWQFTQTLRDVAPRTGAASRSPDQLRHRGPEFHHDAPPADPLAGCQPKRCCRRTTTCSPASASPMALHRAARSGSQCGPAPDGIKVASKG